MNDYTVAIEQQSQIVKKAEDAMRAALEAATASKKAKNIAIADRATNYQKQLAALESLIGAKTAELAEEVAKGDKGAAKKLEADITALTAQAEDARLKIRAIGGAELKADPELVLTAIRAYAKASAAKAAAAVELHRAGDGIKAQIRKLNQQYDELEKQARVLGNEYGIDRHADALIHLYEEAFGEIDVTGHACGTATEAKFRFIKGSSRGLERTAAAKALADLQCGQI